MPYSAKGRSNLSVTPPPCRGTTHCTLVMKKPSHCVSFDYLLMHSPSRNDVRLYWAKDCPLFTHNGRHQHRRKLNTQHTKAHNLPHAFPKPNYLVFHSNDKKRCIHPFSGSGNAAAPSSIDSVAGAQPYRLLALQYDYDSCGSTIAARLCQLLSDGRPLQSCLFQSLRRIGQRGRGIAGH